MMTHLCMFVSLLGLLTSQLLASNCSVTIPDDDGPGSLRQIIRDEICDTITFASNLVGDTIRLTDGQIVIDRDLVIIGLGADNLAISGNNNSRVFKIESDIKVEMNGLSIQEGSVSLNATAPSDDPGGGIWNEGELRLRECKIQNNRISLAGQFIVRNGRGGGIYNDGNLYLYGCEIMGNAASGGNGYGGGIYNSANGVLSIEESGIYRNGANSADRGIGAGGGVYNVGELFMVNSTLSTNGAFGRGSGGGGMVNAGNGQAEINHCTIVYNRITSGVSPGIQNQGERMINIRICE